jgi:glutamyl-tRNA reductase
MPILRLVVIGADHRSSAQGLRDRLFLEEGDFADFLAALKRAGLAQAIVLSTCDRVEVQAAHENPDAVAPAIAAALGARASVPSGEIMRALYVLRDDAALRRIFGVAASLESQIVGEPQVLGQVKEAHRRAQAAGLMGPELEASLKAAYAAAKRVRSETAIAERPVSLASAAVQLARDVHGELARCTGLLVGAGDMGELLIEYLKRGGLRHLVVTGANAIRAADMARGLAGHVAPFARLADALSEADIVVTAAGTGEFAITAQMTEAALRRRRRVPIFFIDLGVPADVEPAVERLDGAFRYDLDDLERLATSGRATREAEAAAAWAIVEDEIAAFLRARAERVAVPAIMALRHRFEAARARALADAGGDPARATELLVNRLLHAPSEALRRLAAGASAEDRARAERLLAELFRLDEWNDRPSAPTNPSPTNEEKDA